jgi:diguanylate cyclase (GGDEF)-like protein/PAS domain S-box-containing protein
VRKDLSWDEAHRWHRRRGRRAIAGATAALVVGGLLSATIALGWRSVALDGARGRFHAFVEVQPAVLERTTERYVRALSVTRGFLEASTDVSDVAFQEFAGSLDIGGAFPALLSIEYIVPRADLEMWVRSVAPPTAAPGLLHHDFGREPEVREALEDATELDGVIVAPPRRDVWNRPRILLAAPVTRNGVPIGWVGATIDPGAFGREVLAGLPAGVRGTLRWAGDDTVLATAGASGLSVSGLSASTTLRASGAQWVLVYEGTAGFAGSDPSFPWVVFLIGLVPAVLAAFVLFFLGRSRMRALLLAERLGRDLAVSEARARAVTEAAVEAILTTDETGRVESVNPAAEALFGWPAADLVGQKVAMVLPSLEAPDGPDGMGAVGWTASEQMLNAHRRDGAVLHVDVSLAPTSVGERPMYILIARDATLRKLHEDQLTHQATHDPLTGLANRQLFDELLVRAVYRTDRSRAPAMVLYVDLDGFKDVNDAFGHQAGDRVLAETARRLEGVVRPGDVVARLGGDEFAVLCENLQATSDAARIAERVVEALRRPIPVASGVAIVTASVGVAVALPGEAAGAVVGRADQAMYEAKRAGKASYAVAEAVG